MTNSTVNHCGAVPWELTYVRIQPYENWDEICFKIKLQAEERRYIHVL